MCRTTKTRHDKMIQMMQKLAKQNEYSIQNKCDVHCEVPLQTTLGKIHRRVSVQPSGHPEFTSANSSVFASRSRWRGY